MAKQQDASGSESKDKSQEGSTVNNLKTLFIAGLKDISWAERKLTEILPQMRDQASSERLITALNDHLVQTQDQVARLDEIFELLGEPAEQKKCAALEGIVKEGNEIVSLSQEGAVRDAAIIGASQKVEHYEMAAYGTLAAYAKILNETEVLNLLLKTLGEEKKSDILLSSIADTHLNSKAMGEKYYEPKT